MSNSNEDYQESFVMRDKDEMLSEYGSMTVQQLWDEVKDVHFRWKIRQLLLGLTNKRNQPTT